MKLSMTGQERLDLSIQITAGTEVRALAVLTVLCVPVLVDWNLDVQQKSLQRNHDAY
jgi:hypothetical protein